MPGPAVILREIHRLRRHARDLQIEIDRGPQALKAQQAKVGRQEELVKEAHETIKRLKVQIREKEVTLRSKVQQIAKHEKQLNEATAKKEYDALRAEINAEKRAVSELEDDILNDMGESEELTAKLPELEKAVGEAKESAARFEQENEGRQAGFDEQLKQANQSLKEIEATLPEDILPIYERLLARMGEDAMSAIQGRTCIACYTEITAQTYNQLLQSQFVACMNCGRILYLPE